MELYIPLRKKHYIYECMRKRFRGLSYGTPFVLSDEMVEAVLSGHKTLTIRVLSKKERDSGVTEIEGIPHQFSEATKSWEKISGPYGGMDYLWVRENYCLVGTSPVYRLDVPEEDRLNYSWLSSLNMPEHVSRYCLKITEHRYLSHVQDLSPMDIYREGFSSPLRGKEGKKDLIAQFSKSWDARHKDKSEKWEANPPVWLTEFRLLSPEEEKEMKKAKDYLK